MFIRFLSMVLHLCSLQGEPYVYAISKTPLLVVDEADRMIEKGHFEELDKLLERMKRSAGNSYSAKNTIFSLVCGFCFVLVISLSYLGMCFLLYLVAQIVTW